MEKYTTILDVAKEANCSGNTVSRYINKKGYVSQETAARIKEAIGKLNYFPSIGARTMKRIKSNTISIIVPSIKNDFYVGLIRGAEKFLQDKDYQIMIFDTQFNIAKERKAIDLSLSYRVDGIIMAFSGMEYVDTIENLIGSYKIPFVCLVYYFDNPEWDFVLFEDEKGSYLLTEHLIKVHGKKRIGIIYTANELNNVESMKRLEGYKKALKNNNLPFNKDISLGGFMTIESGYKMTKELLQKKVDAIYTTNTVLGTGAVKALNELKISCPDDIAFVTYDTYDINTIFHPYVTSLKRVDKIFGEKAAKVLINRMNFKQKKSKVERVGASLELRESCGCNMPKTI